MMRRLAVPAVLCLLLLPLWAGRASLGAEEDVASRLARARFLEHTERRSGEALAEYEAILATSGATAEEIGDALLGLARCHKALGRTAEAIRIWEEIATRSDLSISVKEAAQQERARVAGAAAPAIDVERLMEEQLRRAQAQRNARAEALLEQARQAFATGDLEGARRYCLDALYQEPDEAIEGEAQRLLGQVERALPDRGALLVDFLRFMETARRQALQRLTADVEQLERAARDAFKAADYPEADRLLRQAITAIDGSEFVAECTGPRMELLGWLRRTGLELRERGVEPAPEPRFPEGAAGRPGIRSQFIALLQRLFSERRGAGDPLQVYSVRTAPVQSGATDLVAGAFADGIAANQQPGTLTRARWAERYIRENLETSWESPRVLERFGDVLVVQHTGAIQRRIEKLLSGFSPLPGPLAVDVAMFATTNAGGVRLAAALKAKAQPREEGVHVVVPDRLWEEAIGDVGNLEGVRLLGQARVSLAGGSTSALLALTRRADTHPDYQNLGEPPLTVDASDARFGVWLDLFAEDLLGFTDAQRAAVSVRATARHPHSTVVIPKPHATGAWTRIPKPLAEQAVEAHRVLPHAGTLLLFGLANPFPESMARHPDLVFLVGARRGAMGGGPTPIPDPPRSPTPTVGTGTEERVYPLSPLATEVRDEMVREDWPRQPASIPVPLTVVLRAREEYLAERLGVTWGQTVARDQPNPVTVAGEQATARLLPTQHERLARAVEWFVANEGRLYEVEVTAAEAGEGPLADWLRAVGAQSFTPGTYVLSAPAAQGAGSDPMAGLASTPSLYAFRGRYLARATQRVLARRLQTFTLVESLRTYRMADGRQRYVPIPGLAEEGLVVVVRPELEAENGKRMVTVEARAARIQSIEDVHLPGIDQPDAKVQVPRHHPVQSRLAALPMSDAESVVLTLPAPEGSGRAIVVRVRVRKIQ